MTSPSPEQVAEEVGEAERIWMACIVRGGDGPATIDQIAHGLASRVLAEKAKAWSECEREYNMVPPYTCKTPYQEPKHGG